MTCIVALKGPNAVYMGGDSSAGSAYSRNICVQPKIFKNGDFVIGYTTTFRHGQLLEHMFSPPDMRVDMDLVKYLSTLFVEQARTVFNTGGIAKKEDGRERGGNFLIAYQDRIFEVQSDYSILEYTNRYAAIGCGQDYAYGSLYTSDPALSATERITKALEAATYFTPLVAPPFTILHT